MAPRYKTLLWTLMWHVLVVASILLVPRWIVLKSVTQPMTRVDAWVSLVLASTYVAAVLIPVVWRPAVGHARALLSIAVGHARALLSIAIGATCVSILLAGLILAAPKDLSQRMLLSGATILAAALVVSVVFLDPAGRRPIWAKAIAVTIGVLLLVPLLVIAPSGKKAKVDAQARTETVRANDQMLSVAYFAGYFPPTPETTIWGGAIARDPASAGYLVVRARGDAYRIAWDDAGKLQVQDLGIRVPINYAEFQADVGNRAPTWGFRVADIAVRREGDLTRLYASHHYWMRDRQCFVVRVSTIALPSPDRAPSSGQGDWRMIFESSPCLPITPGRGAAFGGEQVGGNLEFLSERSLLLTLGDNKFDGFYLSPNYVSDPVAHYGKTVTIDTLTGQAAIFTRGHRNPQGLVVSPEGRLWSTEHGPQGGDELNLLHEGGDYGYPYRSYGVEYGSVTWPPGAGADDRKGDVHPVFAWVPSIGISELVVVSDPAFGGWHGDLLIGAMEGRTVWRVRLEDQRVVYTEPIQIGERVRDIAAGPGEFVLWTDSDTIVRISPLMSLNEGAALFTLRCGGCHDPIRHAIGPDLRRLLGRPIAGAEGYTNYSSALRQAGGWWTEERLDEFLANPNSFAPGTTMAIEGISDSAARRQLIEYIKLYE